MADLGWSHDGRLVGRISLGHDLVDRARLVLTRVAATLSVYRERCSRADK
jgi:hypothetical protein